MFAFQNEYSNRHQTLRKRLEYTVDFNLILQLPYKMVEDCHAYLDWCERANKDGKADVLHDITNFICQKEMFQPCLKDWRNREYSTIKQHVWNIFAEAQDAGELNRLNPILDYILLGIHTEVFPYKESTLLTSYEFDDILNVNRGGSEGIYIDWYLVGKFQEDQKEKSQNLHIATLKTLEDDLTAYKIMGEAAGILEYFAQQYVCNNLNLYAPPKNE